MSLHTDFRPNDFESFVGNKTTILKLEKMFNSDEPTDIPHTILLKGPTGCGKTTLARIISTILAGGDKDNELAISERNVGKDRGKAVADSIIKEMSYKPIVGDLRIYILDECQGATIDFWRSMLKPLEEPPGYVYFILCTTDPEKLPKQILGRCSKFDVRPLTKKSIIKLLKKILKSEAGDSKTKFMESEGILEYIADLSKGIPRESLVIADQIHRLKVSSMRNALDSYAPVDEKETVNLARALLKRNKWDRIADTLKTLEKENVSPETIRLNVLGYVKTVLLNSGYNKMSAGQASLIFEYFNDTFQYQDGKAKLVFSCFSIINM